jgi:hypothetical protein
MQRSLRVLIYLACLVGVLGHGLSIAQGSNPDAYTTLGLSSSAGRNFFDSIRRAIKEDDREAVASLVRYPLLVFDKSGHKREIGSPNQLMKEFGSVFSTPVKSAILCQSFDRLMVSNKGVMFANGTLWADVSSAGTGLEIVTLNERAAHTVSCDPVVPK